MKLMLRPLTCPFFLSSPCSVVKAEVKPALDKLMKDEDIDVKYFAEESSTGIEAAAWHAIITTLKLLF